MFSPSFLIFLNLASLFIPQADFSTNKLQIQVEQPYELGGKISAATVTGNVKIILEVSVSSSEQKITRRTNNFLLCIK